MILAALSALAFGQESPPATEPPPPADPPASPPPTPPPAEPTETQLILKLLEQMTAQQAALQALVTQPPAPAPAPAVAPVEPPPPPTVDQVGSDGSFGQTLNLLQQKVTWSAYGDVLLVLNDEEFTFEASHFNPIVGARMGDDLYGEAEIEFEDNGLGVKLEYGYVDWSPSAKITLRAGQFLTPIGEFNDGLHPSFRWNQASRPTMFRDVVPAVWSDVGASVFGTASAGATDFDWNVYVVNGLGGPWDATADEPVRALREHVEDVNTDKGVGARARVTSRPGTLKLMTSLSAYTGEAEPGGGTRLTFVDLAGDLDAHDVGVRFEAAQSFVDDAAFERGAYVQVWGRIQKVVPAARFDVTQRDGDDGFTRPAGAVSVLYNVRPHWNLRAEGSTALASGAHPTGTLMTAFFF